MSTDHDEIQDELGSTPDAGSDSLGPERMALSLLRRAGRRPAPPVPLTNRVYRATWDIWTREVQHRRRVTRRLTWVASLVGAAVGGVIVWQQLTGPVDVAKVTKLAAGATLTRGGSTERVTKRFELRTGDRLDVPSGGALAAQRSDGLSVRVSGPASFVWDSPERVRLDRGRLYVDMGPRHDGDGEEDVTFEVRTPFARIEHIGTRFVADAGADRVRVSVRDGRVRLTSGNGDALGVQAGQAAEAAVNGHIRWVTPPARNDWDWADSLAPPCGIEGRALFDVLTDLAREADLQLVFASPELERRARGLTLHGAALEVPPRSAIDAVLAKTDLHADLLGQRVVLKDRGKP